VQFPIVQRIPRDDLLAVNVNHKRLVDDEIR